MEAWIKGLLALAPASVQSLATGIKDRLLALYSWVNKVLTGAYSAWGKLLAGVSNARNWLVWTAGETLLTLRWLLLIRIPALIKLAVENVTKWANALVAAAKAEAKSLVAALDKWAKSAVTAVTKAVNDVRSWAVTQVNSIIATLVVVRDLVTNLLTSPSRMATWLAAAMTKELWAYAERNADRIFIWAQRKSVAYTVSAVQRIEQLLGRLL